MELTRPARGLKLWLTLQILGTDLIGSAIEHGFQLANWAEEALRVLPDWEIISPAQLAMLTFRYAPKGFSENELNLFNEKISKEILESGYAAVFTTVLNGKNVLLHPHPLSDCLPEPGDHTASVCDCKNSPLLIANQTKKQIGIGVAHNGSIWTDCNQWFFFFIFC